MEITNKKKNYDNLEEFDDAMELIKKYPPKSTPKYIPSAKQWIHNEVKKEYRSHSAIFSTY